MPVVRPFAGLRYDTAVAGPIESLTAPPYDVITSEDQDRLHRDNPYNVVRLILGKDEPEDDDSSNRYTRAGSTFRSWREQRVLRQSPTPSMYPYELTFRLGGHERRIRGVIAEVELEPWGGSIVPHERTMPGPVEDRLRLLRAVEANLSPVYGVATEACPSLGAFLDRAMAGSTAAEMTDETGTDHRLWETPRGSDGMHEATDDLRGHEVMIADGHHRYTVALAYRDEMRARLGPGPWDSIVMFLVDAVTEDPPVLPIHRLLVAPASPGEGAGHRVRDLAEVLATLDEDEMAYGLVTAGEGTLLHLVGRLSGPAPAVCALHQQVLDAFGHAALRFVPDAAAAELAVKSGQAVAAYLLPPTHVAQVWAVVRNKGKLPQKSTFFWPKPRTGLVIRSLAD
jgi:uncharacterized protein (DUF1015 family)